MEDNSDRVYTSDDIIAIVCLDGLDDDYDPSYAVTVNGAYIYEPNIDYDMQTFEVYHELIIDPINLLYLNKKYLSFYGQAEMHYYQLSTNEQEYSAVANIQILKWTSWLITHDNLDDCPRLSKFERNLQSHMKLICKDQHMMFGTEAVNVEGLDEKYRRDLGSVCQIIKNYPKEDVN